MKILIVDDEALVRLGLRTIIPWEKYGYIIAAEASNGFEAMELAQQHRPDIVIADIVMPGMDGLEFIRRTKEILPSCKFIILSCRNDVAFYREAIKLGVSEYIPKNEIHEKIILETLERISKEIWKASGASVLEGELVNRNFVLTEFLNLALKDRIRDRSRILEMLERHGIGFDTGIFRVMAVSADLPGDHPIRYNGNSNTDIINLCQSIVNDSASGFVFKSADDGICVIVSIPAQPDSSAFIRKLFMRMKESVNQYLDIMITAGVGPEQSNFDELSLGYHGAMNALNRKFFIGKGNIYIYDNLFPTGSSTDAVEKCKRILLDRQSPFDVTGYRSDLNTLTEQLSSVPTIDPQKARYIYMDILYHLVGLLDKAGIDIRDIVGEEFSPIEFLGHSETLTEINSNLTKLLTDIQNYYNREFRSKQIDLIYLIKQYVENHIYEKITQEIIASNLYFSTAYISRYYKKEIGISLSEYIISQKIEKSKEMLLSSCSLGEISEKLGFSSESYFIKVFKTITRMTPRQYRKQLFQSDKE